MTSPTIRRPDFAIDEAITFQWPPAHRAFGPFGYAFTFLAIAFERSIEEAIPGTGPLPRAP